MAEPLVYNVRSHRLLELFHKGICLAPSVGISLLAIEHAAAYDGTSGCQKRTLGLRGVGSGGKANRQSLGRGFSKGRRLRRDVSVPEKESQESIPATQDQRKSS